MAFINASFFASVPLRVEFLLKTDSGYPKDTGVNKPFVSPIASFLFSVSSRGGARLKADVIMRRRALEGNDTFLYLRTQLEAKGCS